MAPDLKFPGTRCQVDCWKKPDGFHVISYPESRRNPWVLIQ